MLSEKHKDDLYGSGLNDDIIEQIGFKTCDAAEANRLLDRRDINCDCLVIPYPGIPDFFRLKPDQIILNADGKPAKYLARTGSENRIFLYEAVRQNLISSNGVGRDLPLMITEGEKKTAKLTQEFYLKKRLYYPIGLSGVWNWRTKKLVQTESGAKYEPEAIDDLKRIHLAGRECYICFDSDITINPQVQEAENALGHYLLSQGVSRVACIRLPSQTIEGKECKQGADDYLVKHDPEDFLELVGLAQSSGIIKYILKLMRKIPTMTKAEKLDYMVTLILRDLKSAGSLYYDTNGSYYFSNSKKLMRQIEEEKYSMQIADDYGLYRDTVECNNVISKIEEAALFNGKPIKVKHFSYFDSDAKTCFVYDNRGSIITVREDSIGQEFNGYNNIFFKHSDVSPIKYYPQQRGYFDQYILDVCNFQETEHSKLGPEHQRLLFVIWFYTLFFPNLMPTKPILVMTGDYGSGKSTIQRIVGKLLFGDSFNVSTIQGERDFLTSVINKYYLVFDNVDINEEWVRNAIASLSTGFKIEVRKLYSNMEMFQADPISYLAMNSMGQGIYKRPDVASRLLIFRTKRIASYIPGIVLERNVITYRDNILSEVLDNLKEISKYVDDKFTYTGNFRMADFANIGLKIATAFNKENEFKNILNIIGEEQALLPLEDNPMVELLDKWLAKRLSQDWITTGDLYAELKKIADDGKYHWPFKSLISFGRAMQMSLENLKHLYNIDWHRGKSNKTFWSITHK